MRAVVKKNGLLIPKKYLKGIDKVEIKIDRDRLVISPLKIVKEDPIFSLGKHPGHSGLKDASVNHDKYVYERD
jgi:hypothetical protein